MSSPGIRPRAATDSSSTWRNFNPLTRVTFLQRVMLYVPHSAKRYHELALTTEPFFDTIFTPEHGVALLHRWSAKKRQLAVDAQLRHERRHDCVPLLALLLLHPYDPPIHINLQQAAQLAMHRVDGRALRLFARTGVELNALRDERNHHRPLHVAAICGDTELAAAALRAGADQTARTRRGETPLLLAASWGEVGVLKMLLEAERRGPKLAAPRFGTRALLAAASHGHADCVAALLRAGVGRNAKDEGKTAAYVAAAAGHGDVLRLLIDARCDLELEAPSRLRPLHSAAANGHAECVSQLLRAGADKDAQASFGETPLFLACKAGHAAVVALLLAAACNVETASSAGWRPLHTAVFHGHAPCVALLLRAGGVIWPTLPDGRSAVYLAAERGHPRTLKQLLDDGCAADDPALHAAATAGHADCVAELLRAGANKNVVYKGKSAAFAATEGRHVAVLKLFVDARCNLEWATAEDGHTALHAACKAGNIECVRELLRGGADKARTTKFGRRPADVVKKNVEASRRGEFFKLLGVNR